MEDDIEEFLIAVRYGRGRAAASQQTVEEAGERDGSFPAPPFLVPRHNCLN